MTEGGGEVGLDGFLAGAEFGEGGAQGECAAPGGGAQPLVEKLDDDIELVVHERLVEWREHDGLREAGRGFDEDEFAARSGATQRAAQDGVGGELEKVGGVVRAQVLFGHGERARDGFDFAENGADDLVDAAGERKCPTLPDELALDRHFEGDVRAPGTGDGIFLFGAGAELVVPVLAELRAPETLRAAAGFLRADGEVGKLADTEVGGAELEGELHARAARAGVPSRRRSKLRAGARAGRRSRRRRFARRAVG